MIWTILPGSDHRPLRFFLRWSMTRRKDPIKWFSAPARFLDFPYRKLEVSNKKPKIVRFPHCKNCFTHLLISSNQMFFLVNLN